MIVITDTSPINYLVLTGDIDILAVLFERVVIPQAVADELLDESTPGVVRQWITAPPAWCVTQSPQGPLDPALAYLGEGEREAIALCQDLGANALLTDDSRARREVQARGIEVIRTLALLERASLRGLVDLPASLARLQETTFYAPLHIIDAMLARHRQRLSPRQPPSPEP
jgi:predicted nucleic acid-binding protein